MDPRRQEVESLLDLAKKRLEEGEEKYGHIKFGPRQDLVREFEEEIADAINYFAMRAVEILELVRVLE